MDTDRPSTSSDRLHPLRTETDVDTDVQTDVNTEVKTEDIKLDVEENLDDTDGVIVDENIDIDPGGTDGKIDEPEEVKYFRCYLCNLEESYDYYGSDPPFVRKFVMEEDCYVVVDPFVAPRKGEFLTLGSNCSVCEQAVCKDPECSFFYTKTYCVKCLRNNVKKFPEFLNEKIKRILK